MPTDRHTATGTCEFGHYANKWIPPRAQEKIAPHAKDSSPTTRKGFEELKEARLESGARRRASARAASAARREGLDPHRVAYEGRHHEHADEEEHDLQRVDAVVAEPDQARDRPAAGEGSAEHLGADQDRGAQDRGDVLPQDPPRSLG